MEPNLSPEQKQAKQEQLGRGEAFEEMVRSNGWKLIQGYYQNRVIAFTNGLLASDKDITEFNSERQELVGLKKLFSYINTDIEALKREVTKPTSDK